MSNTAITTKRYYPKLSEIITVDDLPEFLDFVENGLNGLLDQIHYKDLQFSKSFRGETSFYSLEIVTKDIGLNLPFGLRLILNPDEQGSNAISSFPVTVQYQWGILSFLRNFRLENFDFTPAGFFDLGLDIFKITDEQVLIQILNYFVSDIVDATDKYQQILDDINRVYQGANLAFPQGMEPSIPAVVTLIRENTAIPDSISAVMFAAYIANADAEQVERRLQQFYDIIIPGGVEAYIRDLITPKFRASLTVSAGVEFPTNVLRPVTADGLPISNAKSIFKFAEATLFVDSEEGIGYDAEVAGSLIPEFNQIGNTGLILSFTGAKFDMSSKTNIPEADAAGMPVDFMGLYVKRAAVTFGRFGADDPDRPSARISADNLFLGTGGVSGTIALEDNGLIYRKFGNFGVELDTFSITFRQNAIIGSQISGRLTLERFVTNGQPASIQIKAFLKENGDFEIIALPGQTVPPISLPNVFDFYIRTMSVGRTERGYYIAVAGRLDFTAQLPSLGRILPKGIEISKLLIWDNGDLEFEAGTITLGTSFILKISPAKMEISRMMLGAHRRKVNGIDRRYVFFGFDGMVNTGSAGIDTYGNGIKYYFTIDNNSTDRPFDQFLSIDSIAIDLTIPGNVSPDKAAFVLNGYLGMKNPDPDIASSNAATEYTGSVAFRIPKLKMGGSAGMRLTPSIPAFVVDIGLQLSTPIPLGATALGIYDFRGLIGQSYVPSKSETTPPLPDSASWWDYYKAKSTITHREGIEIDKFAQQSGFSLGAGISIATAFDSGLIFSSKLFLLLGLPDVFLIQGQAGILSSRVGLRDNNDPPFSALIAIDSNSFRGNLGVDYKLPSSGAIFSLKGSLDLAFFFNNASGWYLNIGKDQPDSARVQARILTLFNGYAYMMISSRGFKAGAGARFDFNLRFGPVGAGFGAYLDMGGSLSFKPVQIGAFIRVGGYAYLKVFWFKIGLDIQLTLAVEAPNPFNIIGGVQLKLKTPWPLPDVKFRFELAWRINSNRSVLLQQVPVLQIPDPVKGYLPVMATNALSEETFPVNYVKQEFTGNTISIPVPGSSAWQYDFTNTSASANVTIPLDSFIDIELLKPVRPADSSIGGAGNQSPSGYVEFFPPQKGVDPQISHQFELTGLDIYAWKPDNSGGGSWVPYNVYEAVSAIVHANTGSNAVNLGSLKAGYWQFTEPGRYNKIRLLAQNMFSYAANTTDAHADLDKLNFKRKDVFCFENVVKSFSIDWHAAELGEVYAAGTTEYNGDNELIFDTVNGVVKKENAQADAALYLEGPGTITVILPRPASSIDIDFGSNENDVFVSLLKTEYRPYRFGYSRKIDRFVDSLHLEKSEQHQLLHYDNLDEPVDKIVLDFSGDTRLDYTGDLVIGGYYRLPAAYSSIGGSPFNHFSDSEKALMYVAVYDRAFDASAVLAKEDDDSEGAVGLWPMTSGLNAVDETYAIVAGSPDLSRHFFEHDQSGSLVSRPVYNFNGNEDALLVPYQSKYKIENGNFAIALTAIFDPFESGISTLFKKISIRTTSGERKGFTLHLKKQPLDPATVYNDIAMIPHFSVVLTCYDGADSTAIEVEVPYSLNCSTGMLEALQYKQLMVSVDRTADKLEIFADRRLLYSDTVPDLLSVREPAGQGTYLNRISYMAEVTQRKQQDNQLTPEGLIEEIQLMNDNLNKTIQPVWRPDTTFAVVVRTRDTVESKPAISPQKSYIFGFRTAGPLGHFHQQNKAYQALAAADKGEEFKLANLRSYIDYERSFPDALSRFDLSKPVFCHNPKVGLVFNKPYLNAMYADWDPYQGLPAIQSSLEVQLLDTAGVIHSPSLVWENLPDQEITIDNYRSLPPDQQVLFLMNLAALQDGCNANPVQVRKKIKRGAFQFPDLEPNKLYTALFNAVYQPAGAAASRQEVHRFHLKSSRFTDFQQQVTSYILSSLAGAERYAIYPLLTAFAAAEIDNDLKVLIDGVADNDPAAVQNYAVPYERLVFGGLKLKNLEPVETTEIRFVVNRDPGQQQTERILGILIRNPEPFNDPKLSATLLSDTVRMNLLKSNGETLQDDQFIYLHARDTSGVFITNAAMDVPAGTMRIAFRLKLFNGFDFNTDHVDVNCPDIRIADFL